MILSLFPWYGWLCGVALSALLLAGRGCAGCSAERHGAEVGTAGCLFGTSLWVPLPLILVSGVLAKS